jgi:PhzF family phenazine biosynthesis protein
MCEGQASLFQVISPNLAVFSFGGESLETWVLSLYHHSMSTLIAVIDAFTAEPFHGNPAAVCLLTGPPPADAWMQSLAAEMNLSETAFLQPQADGIGLRWFTPTREVDLCGHATLASAHFLWENGIVAPHETARFHTRSGLLTALTKDGWIELDLPALPARQTQPPAGLLEALGGPSVVYMGMSRSDLLVEVASASAVRQLQPDMARLAAVDVRGVIVTAKGDAEYDCISRCFYPRFGIPEDPVTGSAHCVLAPYWAQKLGKSKLRAYQASARGGELRLQLKADRVAIAGQAVTVWRGTLAV